MLPGIFLFDFIFLFDDIFKKTNIRVREKSLAMA
jgi:hypothetical protein